jgi:uncharacterized protein
MSTILRPLSQSMRDKSLDVLRGFALAGVLLTFCLTNIGSPENYEFSFLDEAINWPKYLLVENRMYTMLIVIFGIGFYVQLEKARQNEVSLIPAFSRRVIGLVVLGFIHAIFLSTRDILLFYGIAGAALLLVRNLSNRQLLVLFILVFLVLITPILNILFEDPFRNARGLVQPNSYYEHVKYNWQFFQVYHQVYYIYFDMFFHFLLGFWIARAGIFKRIQQDKIFRQRLMLISLAGTLVLIPFYFHWIQNVIGPLVFKRESSVQKFFLVTVIRTVWPIMMMFCVTLYGTILVDLTVRGKKWLRPLAAFGQMALSNYLIQSLVLVPYLLVFDLYNNVPPSYGIILFVIMFSLQLLFSSWWMARFKWGPFEWLLRSFTYWQWQPIRKAQDTQELKSFSLIKN